MYLLTLTLVLACGPKKTAGGDKPTADSGSTDGSSTDGGSTDGGSTDGGSTDGGSNDGGSTDGGSTDGGTPTERVVGTRDVADAAAQFVGSGALGDSLAAGALGADAQTLLVLGAPDTDAGEVQLYAMDGSGWSLSAIVSGTSADDATGSAVGVGDLDGDGIADLVIGARGSDLAADSAGALAVLLGPIDGDRDVAESEAIWTGQAAGDFAGGAVILADLNGDGALDLLVGAGQADLDGGGTGGAYLLDDPLAGGSLDDASAVLVGPVEQGLAGTALAAGDMDGDGLPEVAMGVFGRGGFAGGAWVAAGPVEDEVLLSDDAMAWFEGTDAFDLAGQSVAVLDLDGDGLGELAVGVPGDDGAGAEAGTVLVFDTPEGELSAGDATAQLRGITYDRTGWSLADVGDLDGDGRHELLSGSPGADDSAGAAWLVYGAVAGIRTLSTSQDLRIDGPTTAAALGDALAGVGDVDGDGLPDMLLGAPDAHTAWLVLGEVGSVD